MILMTHLSKYGTFFCFTLLKIFFTFFSHCSLWSFCSALSSAEAPSVECDAKRGKTMDSPALEIKEASAEGRALPEFFFIFYDTRIHKSTFVSKTLTCNSGNNPTSKIILSFSKPSLDQLEVTSRVLS